MSYVRINETILGPLANQTDTDRLFLMLVRNLIIRWMTLSHDIARGRGFPRDRASQRRMFEGDVYCKESCIIIPRYRSPTSATGTLCSRRDIWIIDC